MAMRAECEDGRLIFGFAAIHFGRRFLFVQQLDKFGVNGRDGPTCIHLSTLKKSSSWLGGVNGHQVLTDRFCLAFVRVAVNGRNPPIEIRDLSQY